MKTKHMLGALMALGLMAGAAQAQTVDKRHTDQQDRVANGVASGRLTPGETRRVEHQQGSIDRQENRMRARDGGHLTAANRTHLQTRENRASRRIYHAKHNHRGY